MGSVKPPTLGPLGVEGRERQSKRGEALKGSGPAVSPLVVLGYHREAPLEILDCP